MMSDAADSQHAHLTLPLLSEPAHSVRPRLQRVQTFAEDGKYFDSSLPLLEPLLEPLREPCDSTAEASSSAEPAAQQHDTFVVTTLSLSKVILGSGMLVIPKAFSLLGVGPGLVVLGLVGFTTWFTIAGLVHRAGRASKDTYASLVRTACGKPAKWGILGAVFANCLGMCTALLIIFSDILIGSDTSEGLISELFPSLDPDSPFLDRRVVLAALVLLLFLPLALLRSMSSLSILNTVGVGAVAAFAASTSIVAAAAYHQDQAYPLPWLPDWDQLGWPSTAKLVSSLLAIAPVLLNADICHQSVFPTMTMLKPYSEGRFSGMVAAALALCNTLYALIAVTSIVAFGDSLEDDALNNFSAAQLEPLIGRMGAVTMGFAVRLSYFVSLVGSFVLQLYPLRHCVLEVLLGSNYKTHKSSLAWRRHLSEKRLFVPVTLALLALSYALAVLIPSIWLVISLVGSTCSTLMGFIFPGLVMLMLRGSPSNVGWVRDSLSVVVVLLGVGLFVNGFVSLSL